MFWEKTATCGALFTSRKSLSGVSQALRCVFLDCEADSDHNHCLWLCTLILLYSHNVQYHYSAPLNLTYCKLGFVLPIILLPILPAMSSTSFSLYTVKHPLFPSLQCFPSNIRFFPSPRLSTKDISTLASGLGCYVTLRGEWWFVSSVEIIELRMCKRPSDCILHSVRP